MNEGDIHITVTMPSAVSLERGAVVLREMRLELMAFPEVKDVLSEQGHPEDGTDDEAPNQSETFVIMKPQADWHTGRTKEQVIAAMRAALDRPGVDYNFSQPIKDRVEESISGIRGQIVVKIYGDDLDLMHGKLDEVKAILNGTRGARDVDVYRAGSAQHIVADVDREAAARYGVSVRDVAGRGGGRVRRRAGDVRVGGGAAGRRAREDARADRGRSGGRRAAGGSGGGSARAAGDAGERAPRAAGARRSTGSRGGVSWRSRPTSTGVTWGASSPRRRRASRRG